MPHQLLTPKQKMSLLASLPSLYERNFQKLLTLIPRLHAITHKSSVKLNNIEYLAITIREQCPYTTIIDIDHLLDNALLPDLSMTIRVYYDASMAEVIHYQRQSHFKPSYEYPNPAMHQPLEKRQINLFFDDWLKHCLNLSKQVDISESPTST